MTNFPQRSIFQSLGFLFLLAGMIPLMQWISQQMIVQWGEDGSNHHLLLGAILFCVGLGLLVAWRWTKKFLRNFVILLLVALVVVFLLFMTRTIPWRPVHAAGSLLFSSAILFAFFVQGVRSVTSQNPDSVTPGES